MPPREPPKSSPSRAHPAPQDREVRPAQVTVLTHLSLSLNRPLTDKFKPYLIPLITAPTACPIRWEKEWIQTCLTSPAMPRWSATFPSPETSPEATSPGMKPTTDWGLGPPLLLLPWISLVISVAPVKLLLLSLVPLIPPHQPQSLEYLLSLPQS